MNIFHFQPKVPSKLCPEPLTSSVLPCDQSEDSKWFEIPATMRNTYGRLEVRDENLSINYVTICKLLTIAWRTKKAFVSRIPKISAPHTFLAPFGLYSLPTKAKIYLGPYSMKEFPRVSLLPIGGGLPVSVFSFAVPWSPKQGENAKLRKILPKKVFKVGKPAQPIKEKPSLDKSAEASTSKDISSEGKDKTLAVKSTLVKLNEAQIGRISRPSTTGEGSKSLTGSDSGEEEEADGVAEQLANADHGYFTCSNEKVATVPFVQFGKEECQIKHPMGSKLLRFKSVLMGLKFLNYIYKDMYPGVNAWKYNFGMSTNNSLQDYAYIKSAKVSHAFHYR